MCDRCGFQFKLTNLRKEIVKTKTFNTLVCPDCFDPDQPQLQLGNAQGFTTGGSRDIQWGWAPVGGSRFFDDALTPNDLVLTLELGTVQVTVT